MSNTEKNPELVKLADGLSKNFFGLTLSEAFQQGICISCKQKVYYSADGKAEKEGHIYSVAGQNEYGITALCEYCFDKAFDEAVEPGKRELEIEELESFTTNHQ